MSMTKCLANFTASQFGRLMQKCFNQPSSHDRIIIKILLVDHLVIYKFQGTGFGWCTWKGLSTATRHYLIKNLHHHFMEVHDIIREYIWLILQIFYKYKSKSLWEGLGVCIWSFVNIFIKVVPSEIWCLKYKTIITAWAWLSSEQPTPFFFPFFFSN